MRIVRGFAFAIAICTVGYTGAAAQDGTPAAGRKGTIAVAPIVGGSFPIQYFKASNEDGGASATFGIAAGASGEYYVTDDLAVGARVMFDRFGMDTDNFGDDVSGNWTIFEFGVFGRYLFMPTMTTRPYARAGLLMGKAKGKIEFSDYESEADIAIAPGAELAVGAVHEVAENISVFVEANWTAIATDGKDVDVTTDGEDDETVEAQKHLQWVGIKVGALFYLGM